MVVILFNPQCVKLTNILCILLLKISTNTTPFTDSHQFTDYSSHYVEHLHETPIWNSIVDKFYTIFQISLQWAAKMADMGLFRNLTLVDIKACRLGLVPSYYLSQCWNIVDCTLSNKLQWHFNRNFSTFIQENAFESVVCKMAAILFRSQCV